MSNIKLKEIVEAVSKLTSRKVRLVAVTKHRSLKLTEEVILSGAQIVGENRIDEAEEKFIDLGLKNKFPKVSIHMIGHLQSRKVKKAVRIFDCIQSIDSLKLIRKINSACEEIGKIMEVLIEVNISGEEQKSGFKTEEVEANIEKIVELQNVNLKGLMAMAPFTSDVNIQRKTFSGLRSLSEKLASKFGNKYFQILSMGMSNDYKIAINEGSNMIRIGTALF